MLCFCLQILESYIIHCNSDIVLQVPIYFRSCICYIIGSSMCCVGEIYLWDPLNSLWRFLFYYSWIFCYFSFMRTLFIHQSGSCFVFWFWFGFFFCYANSICSFRFLPVILFRVLARNQFSARTHAFKIVRLLSHPEIIHNFSCPVCSYHSHTSLLQRSVLPRFLL